MQVALVCERCGKIHTEDTDGANLVVDFKMKQMSFICQNKKCKHDNIFNFHLWREESNRSPLPRIKVM